MPSTLSTETLAHLIASIMLINKGTLLSSCTRKQQPSIIFNESARRAGNLFAGGHVVATRHELLTLYDTRNNSGTWPGRHPFLQRLAVARSLDRPPLALPSPSEGGPEAMPLPPATSCQPYGLRATLYHPIYLRARHYERLLVCRA